jgi:hypothetical protein
MPKSVVFYYSPVTVQGDMFSFFIMLKVIMQLIYKIIHILITNNLLTDLEKLVEIPPPIGYLHNTIPGQIKEPIATNCVIAPIMHIEPNLGALVQRHKLLNCSRPEPTGKSVAYVEI